MKKRHTVIAALGLLAGLPLMVMAEQDRPALPPVNPFLIQNSVYPSVHFDPAQTDTTTLPVW